MSESEPNKFPTHWKYSSNIDSFLEYANYLIEQQAVRGEAIPALRLVPERYEEGYSVENDPCAEHTVFGIRIWDRRIGGTGSVEPSYTSTVPGEALAQLIADMVCRATDNTKGEA